MTSPQKTTRHRAMRTTVAASAALALLLGAAACGSDDTTSTTNDTATTTAAPSETTQAPAAGGEPTVSDAWARPSAMMQGAGAVYMEITGGDEADELVAASVPTSIAAKAELHETSMGGMNDMDMDDMGDMNDMDDMDDMNDMGDMDDMNDMSGMMTMREVSAIDIPAGGTVTLEPGGLHIMLIDLAEPLAAGSSFDLTLDFASGTSLVVPVEVRTQ
jgi:copper(I)-binding protein